MIYLYHMDVVTAGRGTSGINVTTQDNRLSVVCQADMMTVATEAAVTAEDMSAEEAEQRVRGLYRRLRGADHFRSLPALDRPASPQRPADSHVAEFWRRRRPVAHFPAELSVSAIHGRLRARLTAVAGCLERPLRVDLHK